jgi:hypothetical protein
MYIEEIFYDIEWECGYATIHKTTNRRGHSLTADIKLALPGEKFGSATFKCKVSLQPRLRDFRRKCKEVDQDLIDAGMLEAPGWHEEVHGNMYREMTNAQRDNPNWLPKFMRFGIGRQSNKWANTARYAPSIAGVMAGYDPGTGMLGISVGKFNTVIDLDKTALTPRQEAAGVVAAGWVKHRPIQYSNASMQAANTMKRRLQAAIQAQQPRTS